MEATQLLCLLQISLAVMRVAGPSETAVVVGEDPQISARLSSPLLLCENHIYYN